MHVVLRLEDSVFVDKPSGQLVHNSAWAGPPEVSLVDDVTRALGADLHPVHRLDRGASGLVLFAPRAQVAGWQVALEAGEKRYLAIVRGHVTAVHDIDHAIVDEGVAREAKSRVTPLALSTVERCSLVEVQLFSGRRHQARRHLKHIAHPVIGDANHGKGAINRDYAARYGLKRLALHAWRLALTPPGASERLEVVCAPPPDLAGPITALFGDVVALRFA